MAASEATLNRLFTMMEEQSRKIDEMNSGLNQTRNDLSQTKTDLTNSIDDQTKTLDAYLKKGIDDAVAPLVKKQEEYEHKNDLRMKKLEELVFNQNHINLSSVNTQQFPQINPDMQTPYAPPAPGHARVIPSPPPAWGPGMARLPPPQLVHRAPHQLSEILPATQLPATHGRSTNDAAYIKNMISQARVIVGLGPITPAYVQRVEADNIEDQFRLSAIEYVRDELGVDSDDIPDDDIEKAFPPNNAPDSEYDSIYVQVRTPEQAEILFTRVRIQSVRVQSVRTQLDGDQKDKLRAFLYIPKRLQDRFRPISHAGYLQRLSGYKTRFVYTDDDIHLLICPKDRFTYYQCPVPNPPKVDLVPTKPPPPGRKPLKRPRSIESSEEEETGNKKDRVLSPEKTAEPDVEKPNETDKNSLN